MSSQDAWKAPATRYTVDVSRVARIVCHRKHPDKPKKDDGVTPTQFLVLWLGDAINAPISWHDLEELSSVLHLVQDYVSFCRSTNFKQISQKQRSAIAVAGKKRKLSQFISGSQLPTPQQSRSSSDREQSVVDDAFQDSDDLDVATNRIRSISKQPTTSLAGPLVYNAVFYKRSGRLIAISRTDPSVATVDVSTMPTKRMLDDANVQDLMEAELAIRQRYKAKLARLPGPPVTMVNGIDRETPSLGFCFISTYVLREGVERNDEIMIGCDKCKPNMGGNCGCEYTKKCSCLEYAKPDESSMDDKQRAIWEHRKQNDDNTTDDLPKRFAYCKTGRSSGCLVDFYLNKRDMIYECNKLCACGPRCKNRNVQLGRKVKLEIFRTATRGFGLRCPEELRRGQFIDTYRGEIITGPEADDREAAGEQGKASYLFTLDKFKGDSFIGGGQRIETEDCHVVDGQFMGGPTRFMNHCCEPNVQMHTVSYNKHDPYVYDLAFFACEDIPAGTELTFDYMDADDTPKAGEERSGDALYACKCGAQRCRGYLWQ